MKGDARLITRMARPFTPGRRSSPGLPDDLLRDSAGRLRIIALVYAGAFVLSETAAVLSDPSVRAEYSQFYQWGPAVLSVVVALVVAGLATSKRIAPSTLMNVGLVFEVVGAFGIAFATYWGVYPNLAYQPEHLEVFGLSFVAAWIVFFTVVSPNTPRRALAAAVAAGSSVPITLILTTEFGVTSIALTSRVIVRFLVVPYVLVVIAAYVGARVVFTLGTAVTRAREMGSYHLTERLGVGGMGEVWRAEHEMLARPAAIKLIRPDMLGDQDRDGQLILQRRFEREAQATALMRSPHTIQVYDLGVTADGTFYYVMELLNGFDLGSMVERFGPLPPERAVYLLRQVCDSLAEAHETGLIHRDMKPANIYVCCQGREVDFAKVLDFGLVKPRDGDGAAEANIRLTAEHVAGGTPAYMSPEQAAGDPIDGRADIYALGCVAYWLVTGQLVFEGKNAMAMMVQHLNTPPQPPSTRTELRIPQQVEDVIMACLEKEPGRRPQSAEDLDAVLANCTTNAQWTPERAREWWALHQPPSAPRGSGGLFPPVA